MYPNQTLIDELISRIVGTVYPLRIVLFGFTARGEMRPDSDIDVLMSA
jgi:predicted nucleotidyltransferase